MKADISSQLTTDTSYFSQLVADIKKGEVKIPQFQRKFVWKDDQALDLLDSVANGYPIGSILLWKTKDKLHAARDIGVFQLPKTDDLTPTNYVLDGQQRLTVIYSCLGAPEDASGYKAGYDLTTDAFVEIKAGVAKPDVFPLRKLFNTTSLLNFRTSLLTLPNAAVLQQRLDDLIAAFTQYKLPVVTLKDLTIDEVCPIFERINSSGTRLSTYDLMVAATWAEDFDGFYPVSADTSEKADTGRKECLCRSEGSTALSSSAVPWSRSADLASAAHKWPASSALAPIF